LVIEGIVEFFQQKTNVHLTIRKKTLHLPKILVPVREQHLCKVILKKYNYRMEKNKLRVIKDYEKLSKELKEQIKLVYPDGFSQYLIQFRNQKGDLISALPFETDDKIYMIKMSVQKAEELILLDPDYDDDGILKSEIKDKYADEHSDVDYLSENDNYDA